MLARMTPRSSSDPKMKWFWNPRTTPASVSVRRLTAGVDDPAKFGQLLRELPESENLRPRLAATFYARAWDPVAERDLWIVSDGARVDCYVIAGLTFQQAATVRVRWDARRREPAEMSLETLGDIVAKVTERSVTLQED
jgi:hypothetical protein